MSLDFESGSSQFVTCTTGSANGLRNKTGGSILGCVRVESQGGAGVTRVVMHHSAGATTSATRLGLLQTGAATADTWRAGSRRLDANASSVADDTLAVTTSSTVCLAAVAAWTEGYLRELEDGAQQANTAVGGWAGNSSNTAASEVTIGVRNSSGYFDGRLSNIAVYDRALSNLEVANIHVARGRSRNYYGCVQYYPMLEGAPAGTASGSGVVRDRMGNANGTPTNSPVYAEAIAYPRPPRRRG